MIQPLQTSIQIGLGICLTLSLILMVYCMITGQTVNTWQFPMMLALFLDSVFVFTILFKRNLSVSRIGEVPQIHPGRSPHHPHY